MSLRILALTSTLVAVAAMSFSPARADTDDLFPFDQPEPVIQPSPAEDIVAALPGVSRVTASSVSPVSSEVAFLVELPTGRKEFRIWNMISGKFRVIDSAPRDVSTTARCPARQSAQASP